MKALEAIHRARMAGLTLEPAGGMLRVRGPKPVRAALLPELAPLAGEILRLLPPENTTPDGAAGQGALNPCNGCGRAAWLALVADDGARTCVDCLTGRTAMRARGAPL